MKSGKTNPELDEIINAASYIEQEYGFTRSEAIEVLKVRNLEWISGDLSLIRSQLEDLTGEMEAVQKK